MADEQFSKEQTAQLVFNAEIKKDIEFIKNSLASLTTLVESYAKAYVPREELNEWKAAADKDHDDFDSRLRFLERYAWAAIGALALFQIALNFLPYIHLGQ